MEQIWETDLDEHGKAALRRYDQALRPLSLNRPHGALCGSFGAVMLLVVLEAVDENRFINWRYPVIVVVAGLSGYLAGRYSERRDNAHRHAVVAALYRAFPRKVFESERAAGPAGMKRRDTGQNADG